MTRPPVYAGLCASLTLTLTLTKTHTGRACPFSTLAGVDILGAELSTIPDIFTILLFYYFVLYDTPPHAPFMFTRSVLFCTILYYFVLYDTPPHPPSNPRDPIACSRVATRDLMCPIRRLNDCERVV